MTENTKHFTTIADFIDQYLTPALSGVEENFDHRAFTDALIDADLLVWDGRYFVIDEALAADAFWALVEDFDAKAMQA